jgi:hypothetical protein
MIRDPVEMVRSLHQQRLLSGKEDVTDLAAAWALQDARLHGRQLPKRCHDPQLLQYRWWCALGQQLARLRDSAPADRFHITPLDALRPNPRTEYLRLPRFLGIEDNGRTQFPVVNAARRHMFPRLGAAARLVKRAAIRVQFPNFPAQAVRRLGSILEQPEKTPQSNKALDDELTAYFRDDDDLRKKVTADVNAQKVDAQLTRRPSP